MSLERTLDLFEGKLEISATGGLTKFTEDSQYLEDFILRVEGLQKAIYNHILVSKIIGPEDKKKEYIAAKRKDLAGLTENLKTLFVMEYKRWLEAGASQDSAKKKALSTVNEYKQKCLKQHQKQFPDNISHGELMRLLTIEKVKSK